MEQCLFVRSVIWLTDVSEVFHEPPCLRFALVNPSRRHECNTMSCVLFSYAYIFLKPVEGEQRKKNKQTTNKHHYSPSHTKH